MPMDYTGKSDPYVVLQLGKENFKTKYIEQDLNPVWNEIFTFDIMTGQEQLSLQVFDHDEFGSDDFCGKFTLSLDAFRDQAQHDSWFTLEPDSQANSELWHGKIRLGIQFVYSKTRILQGYANTWTEKVQEEEYQLQMLQGMLNALESPFGFIKGFNMDKKV